MRDRRKRVFLALPRSQKVAAADQLGARSTVQAHPAQEQALDHEQPYALADLARPVGLLPFPGVQILGDRQQMACRGPHALRVQRLRQLWVVVDQCEDLPWHENIRRTPAGQMVWISIPAGAGCASPTRVWIE